MRGEILLIKTYKTTNYCPLVSLVTFLSASSKIAAKLYGWHWLLKLKGLKEDDQKELIRCCLILIQSGS